MTMHHNVITESHALTDTVCMDPKAKTSCGTIFLSAVVFTVIFVLSTQGAQGSPQTTQESSLGDSSSLTIIGSSVNVAKRQTEATSPQDSALNEEGTPSKVGKSSGDTRISELVTEESDGSADPKEGQASEDTAGHDPTPKPAGQADEGEGGTKSSDDHRAMPGLKGISSEAVLRGFYVFVGVGTIVLLYIVIKLLRLRRRRATRKYRVLSHNDDQEMFPLAADDGDDEEIYNAVDHQNLT